METGTGPDEGKEQQGPRIEEISLSKLGLLAKIQVGIRQDQGQEPQGHHIEEIPLSELVLVQIYHRRLSIKGEPKIPLGLKFKMSNKITKATASL